MHTGGTRSCASAAPTPFSVERESVAPTPFSVERESVAPTPFSVERELDPPVAGHKSNNDQMQSQIVNRKS